MRRLGRRLERSAVAVLAPTDRLMNRLYGWRHNPLYHSGALVVALMAILFVTGIYLLIFYRIGSPYSSVERLSNQVWLGSWIRSLHRYASDAAVVAALIHMFRVFAERRSWGPRALAWVSGLVLLFVIFVAGWTGYVMVWDVQALVLAREGARFLDALPFFAEPIQRAFVGDREIPSAFFFLNLFLHVALPVGLIIILWIHVSRVARPGLLPPKRLLWGAGGLLLAMSVLWPVVSGPAADLLRVPPRAPFDVFYSFFLPLAKNLPAGWVWLLGSAVALVLLLVPWWVAPARQDRPQLSVVNQELCDACEQCYQDCPYEAISMVEKPGSRRGVVAQVDWSLCVGCGICAGSCAPMGVGPPRMNGRNQLSGVRRFIEERDLGSRDVVVVACSNGAGNLGASAEIDGAPVYAAECAGSVHTSVIEFLVRSGVGGVLIASCPPRDCWHREGPKWLEQRLYHDREAELKERVDRRRVRLAYASLGERDLVRAALAEYRADLVEMELAEGERDIDLDLSCEVRSQPLQQEVRAS